jgi:spore coat protein U-like protein
VNPTLVLAGRLAAARHVCRRVFRGASRPVWARVALAAAFLAVLCTHPAAAQNCTLAITGPLNFGTYTGSQIRSTTPYSVSCAGAWDIPMYTGAGAGASETERYLTGPNGAELGYEINRDSAYSQNWGDTYPTDTVNGTGNYNGAIYAQLNSGQIGPPGTYTDTVDSATTHFTLTVSANPLSFGNYSGAVVDSTTTLSVTCTDTIPYDVGLSAGTGTGATVTSRKMTGPAGALLNYSLFSNSGYSTNWGNAAGSWLAGTGTGAAQTLTVYGQVPANQHPTPGNYTDTIVVTVNY